MVISDHKERTVSAQDVSTIRTAYEEFAAHNAAAVLAKLDPRVEWVEGGGGDAPSGTFVGPDAVASGVFAEIGANFDEYHVDPIEFVDNVHEAFERVKEIEANEGRTFVHPFEGPKTALGTASVGMEFIDQVRAAGARLDAVIVAAGGGGLAAGIACAVKQMSPQTAVCAVEPEGANSLSRSFEAGSPQSIQAVRTIADSLGAPRCEPYSFALCRRFVDEVALVNDDQIREAMRWLFRSAKLAVEPAAAASLAALLHPLRSRLEQRSIGVVVFGANIDPETFARLLLP